MRRYLIAALFSFIICFVSFGQTALPSAPQVQHFVISANAAGYGGNQAVSIVSTGVALTEYVSVAFDRISNPMDTQKPIYNIGDLNVHYELGDLLPKAIKSKLSFDPTNWIVTFQGSAGKVTAPGVDRIAEGLGVYVSRPVSNNVQMTCGYRFLHGAGVGTTWVKVPSVGLNFTF